MKSLRYQRDSQNNGQMKKDKTIYIIAHKTLHKNIEEHEPD